MRSVAQKSFSMLRTTNVNVKNNQYLWHYFEMDLAFSVVVSCQTVIVIKVCTTIQPILSVRNGASNFVRYVAPYDVVIYFEDVLEKPGGKTILLKCLWRNVTGLLMICFSDHLHCNINLCQALPLILNYRPFHHSCFVLLSICLHTCAISFVA